METSSSGTPEDHTRDRQGAGDTDTGGDDPVERRLAHYAFVREERDREVRLLFRNVSALEVALAFKAAGAAFISIAGESVRSSPAPDNHTGDSTPLSERTEPDEATDKSGANKDRGRKEVKLRYFYGVEDTTYTVSIAANSGTVPSIMSAFRAARLVESELNERLGVVFAP